MKPTRNSRSALGVIDQAERRVREILWDVPRTWLIGAREKTRNLPKTNFDLGMAFAQEGKWYDALFRYRIALYLNPAYPEARYNIGCCYYNLGRLDKAKTYFLQVLKDAPGNHDAVFMLGAIDPASIPANQRPSHMPSKLVTDFFTSTAANYSKIEAQNRYRGGVLVAEQVKSLLPAQGFSVIDLGCGTGIAAIPYQADSASIIGVDVTQAMVKIAAATRNGQSLLYTQVMEADISKPQALAALPPADLVLLVNVVQFVGGLEIVLANAANALKTGGILAITLEPFSAPTGYGLMPSTGRFGHSSDYAIKIAETQGLTVVKQGALALYEGAAAHVLILRRNEPQ